MGLSWPLLGLCRLCLRLVLACLGLSWGCLGRPLGAETQDRPKSRPRSRKRPPKLTPKSDFFRTFSGSVFGLCSGLAFGGFWDAWNPKNKDFAWEVSQKRDFHKVTFKSENGPPNWTTTRQTVCRKMEPNLEPENDRKKRPKGYEGIPIRPAYG